jgi:hypothetical protein
VHDFAVLSRAVCVLASLTVLDSSQDVRSGGESNVSRNSELVIPRPFAKSDCSEDVRSDCSKEAGSGGAPKFKSVPCQGI